jgi:molecular chaperone GrpE
MFDSQPSPVSPEEEPVTSRDESGEPSGDEDPGVEREILEEKEQTDEQTDSSPEDRVAQAQRERDEFLDLARRAQADFENYRKRAAQQAADAERKARAALARDLIPAIDNLERALESAPDDDPLADGVRLVHRELTEALDRAGVTSFDPTGEKFDPSSSEALSAQPGDGAEPGTVLESLTRGYRIADQVIRPARVVVAQ